MICMRCEGTMVQEQFHDLLDDEGRIDFQGWRCLNCGNIHDHLILANRQKQAVPAGSRRV